jgi:hypothetical protein
MRLLRKAMWVAAALVLAGGTGCAAASPVLASPVLASTGRSAAAVSAQAPVPAKTPTGVTVAAARGTASAPGKRVDQLAGVSCVGGTCYAAGYTISGTSERTLIEAWNGEKWVREPAPPAGAAGSLAAISCAKGNPLNRCLAAGAPDLAGSGGSWRVAGKGGSQLDAVSCPSAGACVLVGETTKDPVYATWNGTTFKNGTLHVPPHSFQTVTVSGVSCASPVSCVAVGDYTYGVRAMPSPSARDKVLAEQWNGHGWRLLPAVNVSDWNQLTAVSCVSASDCTAVGTSQNQFPLAERWNGVTWKAEPVPTVSAIGYLFLTSVSCPASGFCVAAGSYQGEPVAETWNGSKWRVGLLPLPSGDNHSAQLNGVSCVSRAACVAVGVSGNGTSYAEVYAGGKWRLSATVNPV